MIPAGKKSSGKPTLHPMLIQLNSPLVLSHNNFESDMGKTTFISPPPQCAQISLLPPCPPCVVINLPRRRPLTASTNSSSASQQSKEFQSVFLFKMKQKRKFSRSSSLVAIHWRRRPVHVNGISVPSTHNRTALGHPLSDRKITSSPTTTD